MSQLAALSPMCFPSPNRHPHPLRRWIKALDIDSLWFRLTLGVVAVFAVGFCSVAAFMYVQIHHTLILSHKQNMKYIVERFPLDVAIYSNMVTLQQGIQRAINGVTTSDTLLWVRDLNGKLLAQSDSATFSENSTEFFAMKQLSLTPELKEVDGRYWLMCVGNLYVKGQQVGNIYMARDITEDQKMFWQLVWSLTLATFLCIGCMVAIIAFYVRRSLLPLHRISYLTEGISAERLNKVQVQSGKNSPSEVRQLADTFEQMLTRLSESWDHQRQLVSNVSHELRTPLTVVSGYLQSLLRRGQNLTEPQREALEIAASEAERTIQLLQDLLDLARADSGNVHYKVESLTLQPFLDEVAETARNFCDRPILLESPPTQTLTIKADPNRLKQILLNLLDNAVKYSEAPQPVTLKLQHHAGRALIQVCDHGVGIPLADQMRIFERFYRVDEARSRTTGSTGLGLSIVKTLVVGMGGNITVQSQPGRGSTFTVSFPTAITTTQANIHPISNSQANQ